MVVFIVSNNKQTSGNGEDRVGRSDTGLSPLALDVALVSSPALYMS